MEYLSQNEAITLFKKKVGESTLCSHPGVSKLAEIAAKDYNNFILGDIPFSPNRYLLTIGE